MRPLPPLAAFLLLVLIGTAPTPGRGESAREIPAAQQLPAAAPLQRTTAEIMARPQVSRPGEPVIRLTGAGPSAPQPVTLNFNAVTGPTETGAFPPDTSGAAGITQFFVFVTGRLRTFNKTTGVADGIINVDSDVFFSSVMTPTMAGEVVFTNNPNVRYDRLSGRWFLSMKDEVRVAASGAISRPNRILLAVSDAASAGIISAGTVWTFYQFQGDATLFTDYPGLGIDASALYIGADMFTTAAAFNSTKGFVIPKAPALSASPLTVWAFVLVPTATSAGPESPRGVDNYDPTNTGPTALGYLIGADNAVFNLLMIRRVTNPGSLGPAPTISANISVATPLTTRYPVLVPHLGNTGGVGGRLDALNDRLFAAHLRNGRLWTAHNIGVNNTGVAGAANNRNAARWYELQNLSATPSVRQSGTLFDNNAVNDGNQRNYWMPSIMVSGQGHAALGCSIAGTNERINAFTTGRLVGDTLGTLRDGPGGAAFPGYTAAATAYNPPGDPGGPSRKWGRYSYTSLDPKDDMTMWTIQEYCNATNTYGCRVARLGAPPPATPASASPAIIPPGQSSTLVTITGTSVSGSGFYDPGTDGFAITPNRIGAVVSGSVIVNSITFTDPTHVTLDLSTIGAAEGARNVTVTNPDGQALTGNGILTVAEPLQLTAAASVKAHAGFGPFSINLPLAGEPGVECRSSSGNHTLLFSFSNNVVSGNASVTSGTGVAAAPTFAANVMTVNLSGVTDIQKITVTLSNITDNFGQVLPNAAVSVNMLIGDTSGNKTVNASDIGQTKGQSGAPVTGSNFRTDVNANGSVNAGDISLVKANAGNTLP